MAYKTKEKTNTLLPLNRILPSYQQNNLEQREVPVYEYLHAVSSKRIAKVVYYVVTIIHTIGLCRFYKNY